MNLEKITFLSNQKNNIEIEINERIKKDKGDGFVEKLEKKVRKRINK